MHLEDPHNLLKDPHWQNLHTAGLLESESPLPEENQTYQEASPWAVRGNAEVVRSESRCPGESLTEMLLTQWRSPTSHRTWPPLLLTDVWLRQARWRSLKKHSHSACCRCCPLLSVTCRQWASHADP